MRTYWKGVIFYSFYSIFRSMTDSVPIVTTVFARWKLSSYVVPGQKKKIFTCIDVVDHEAIQGSEAFF